MPGGAEWVTTDSVRRALAKTPDHEAGTHCNFVVEIPVTRLGYLPIDERSSPTTDTVLHDAVYHFFSCIEAACPVGNEHFPEKVLPTSNEEKCGVPNGI